MQRIIKHIAPRSMTVNGDTSPCECSEGVTCSYCVQANLALMKKRYQAEDDRVKSFISHVHKEGVRISARRMGLDEGTLRRWIKNGNIPGAVIEKFTEARIA